MLIYLPENPTAAMEIATPLLRLAMTVMVDDWSFCFGRALQKNPPVPWGRGNSAFYCTGWTLLK